MTLIRHLSILLVGFISACAEPKAAARPDEQRIGPGEHLLTLNSGSLERLYLVYVPPGYDGNTPVPLVILFHGGGHCWPNGLQYFPKMACRQR